MSLNQEHRASPVPFRHVSDGAKIKILCYNRFHLKWQEMHLMCEHARVRMLLTFVDFTEGSATKLLNNSVAFLQNFLAFLEHDFNYDYIFLKILE